VPPSGAALVILLGTSFTPGAQGSCRTADLGCPVLDVPEGYEQTPTRQDGPDHYECSWQGETDLASAPLLDGSSWVPIPANRYIGSCFLNLSV
jgi:hypothetical protein